MFFYGVDYYNLPDEQKKPVLIGLIVLSVVIFGIYGILYFVKKKYEYKIEHSKSKIIKKIFDEV